MKGKLYLIPNTLGDTALSAVIPADVIALVADLKFFVVENAKAARQFLKKANPAIDYNATTLFELNEHTSPQDISAFIKPLLDGNNMGLLSDAGCPSVADPGASIVSIAHTKGIDVIPLVGPSSILLSLMASGFNGQNFAFHGYLPKQQNERINKIKQLNKYCKQQTQLFIETPYRNKHLFDDILKNSEPTTKLCVAVNITLPTQLILTQTIAQWQKDKTITEKIDKQPCIFLMN